MPTIWDGKTRPTPDEVRSAAYDNDPPQRATRKLLICSAPRTSSKRLSRLLLGAGIGVPMEYFNSRSVEALTARWKVRTSDYRESLYQRRSANGVFAVTLQHHQIRGWRHAGDVADLFDGATIAHLIREDRDAQAASLAACMLTGNWGFDGPSAEQHYSLRALRKAARQAIEFLDQEQQDWARHFDACGIVPQVITDRQVIADPTAVVMALAERLGVVIDSEGLERMKQVDEGPYAVDRELKAQLLPLVLDIRSER